MKEDSEQEPFEADPENNDQERSNQVEGEKDPTKIHIERNPAQLIGGFAGFFKSILSLRDNSGKEL